MIDFSTLQGLAIPEGVVTQIEDASGRVIWMLKSGNKVVLQVEKITADTYAGETTYTGEQFILLDIYPKTNGTVSVTYGGLTKTITDTSGAEKPNAQNVFFGTLYGVSDSVETPVSGELTIEGDFSAFSSGTYTSGGKLKLPECAGCVTTVNEWGNITELENYAFCGCAKLTSIIIPKGVQIIPMYTFSDCSALRDVTIPSSVNLILAPSSFSGCDSLREIIVDDENQSYLSDNGVLFDKDKTIICKYPASKEGESYTIPDGVTTIESYAFSDCSLLTSYVIPASVTSIDTHAFSHGAGLARTITFFGTTPPTLPKNSGGTINWPFGSALTYFVVPKGCGDVYRSAGYVQEGDTDRITEAG